MLWPRGLFFVFLTHSERSSQAHNHLLKTVDEAMGLFLMTSRYLHLNIHFGIFCISFYYSSTLLGDWNKHVILQGIKSIIFFHTHGPYCDSLSIWDARIAQSIQWHWLTWSSKLPQVVSDHTAALSSCFLVVHSEDVVKSQRFWIWCWCVPAKEQVFGFTKNIWLIQVMGGWGWSGWGGGGNIKISDCHNFFYS